MAGLEQLFAEVLEVVDFTVEGEGDGAVLVEHGLMAGRAEVDDAEAIVDEGEAGGVVAVSAPVVRAAVGHHLGGAAESLGRGGPSGRSQPKICAHGLSQRL